MTQLSDLFPEVLPDVPGCSNPLALRAMKNANIAFHRKSQIYCQDIPVIPIVADQAKYTVANPSNFQVINFRNVLVDDKPVTQKSEDQLDNEWVELSRAYTYRLYHHSAFAGLDATSWRTATSQQPKFYYSDTPNDIRLVAIPNVATIIGIKIKVALQPDLATAAVVTDWIFEEYYRVIAAGSLAELFRLPNKKWSNPANAEFYRAEFSHGCNEAHNDKLRGFTRNDQTTGRTQAWS